MVAVYEGRVHFLGFIERPIYGSSGPVRSGSRPGSATPASLVIFSGVSILVTYLLIRIQGSLPLNPQHLGACSPALSWNTAVSFVTNTNWQNYLGETTMSYFSQMAALTVQQFVSAAVGIAVAVALIRGFARKGSPTIGNFWVDTVRGGLYILFPIAFVAGLDLRGPGCGADPGRAGSHPQRSERSHPDHRPRAGRLHGGHQAARHERRRLLQCQRCPSLREPDGPHRPVLVRPAACDSGGPDLRLRQDGGPPHARDWPSWPP